jgi:hypothetical protein
LAVAIRVVPRLVSLLGIVELEADSEQFHVVAVRFARFDVPSPWIYGSALGWLYRTTTASQILGELSSIAVAVWVVWATSSALPARGAHSPQAIAAIALLAVSASGALFTSTTLREPFQMLAVVAAASAIKWLRAGRAADALVPAALALALSAALHPAMLFGLGIVAVIELSAAAIRPLVSGRRQRPPSWSLALPAVIIGALTTAGPVASRLSSFVEGATDFRGRTAYLDPSTSAAGPARFVRQVLGYFLAPFPWQVRAPFDVVVLAENGIRIALIVFVLLATSQIRDGSRVMAGVYLRAHLTLELAWSTGTLAWGTAFRHHLPSMVLLALAVGHAAAEATSVPATRRPNVIVGEAHHRWSHGIPPPALPLLITMHRPGGSAVRPRSPAIVRRPLREQWRARIADGEKQ